MRVTLLIAALLLLVATADAADKTKLVKGLNQDFVWTDDKDIPDLIQAMKDARVQSVRLGIRWTSVEPERGKWAWDKPDRVIRQLRAAKIDILCTFMSVPAWASGVDPKKTEGFWDCYQPKDIKDWQEYVRRVTTRYKSHIKLWEIWNEENGEGFYKPMPNAREYVNLLKVSYTTIKKVDPKATVVLGGLVMNGIVPNPWSPIKIEHFLQKIYDEGGKPYFDVANIHPYVTAAPNEGPAYCARLTRDTVEVMKKNGDGAKPLWITETGLFTNDEVTEQMQAEHLKGVYREIAMIPQVKALYWFHLRDLPGPVCGGEETMGLLAGDHRRKPSFEAYKNLVY